MDQKVLKKALDARMIAMKAEIKYISTDPEVAIEFERVGKMLDKVVAWLEKELDDGV